MTINLSTPVKYIASIGVTALLVAATIYADEITTLSQTAKSGDQITHDWVNAVAMNSVAAASGNKCIPINSYEDCKNALLTIGETTKFSYKYTLKDNTYVITGTLPGKIKCDSSVEWIRIWTDAIYTATNEAQIQSNWSEVSIYKKNIDYWVYYGNPFVNQMKDDVLGLRMSSGPRNINDEFKLCY